MNKTILFLCTLTAAFAIAAPDADAASRVKARGAVQNAEGGITTGGASAARGPNGGAAARGRAIKTDGQGNGQATSGGTYRGPNGGTGARAGSTTWNADGSAQHQSGAQWSGANRSGSTQGTATRSADGTYSGGRQTHASGTQSSSYSADTRYGNGTAQRNVDATGKNGYRYAADVNATKGEGVTRTATCYDPNGAAIPCKQ